MLSVVAPDIQIEFLRAMQAIHAPCEILHNKEVAEIQEKHQREIDALNEQIEDMKERTKGLLRWRLELEERNTDGGYASGSPIYFGKPGYMSIWDDTDTKSFALEFEKVEDKCRYWEQVGYDCMDTHGFVDRKRPRIIADAAEEGDKGDEEDDKPNPYRIICRSNRVLNLFTAWAERTGEELEEGAWGFIEALKY